MDDTMKNSTQHGAQETEQPRDGVLVAVASNGDGLIDAHFGEADAFTIYTVAAAGVKQVDRRVVDAYRLPDGGDEDRRDVILRALSDCVACFVARVGDAPRKKLSGAGIEAVSIYADRQIEPSLMAWFAGYRAVPQA